MSAGDRVCDAVGQFTAAWISPPWIACADRMPDDNEWVLVSDRRVVEYRKYGFMTFSTRRCWRSEDHTRSESIAMYTHWMPKPEPSR